MSHLVFYDGQCGLCDRIVNFILWADKEKKFVFAPLQGETAKRMVPEYTDQLDTLVLIENWKEDPKIWIMSHAAFRILWLLGGFWRLIGWKYMLPAWTTDWAYRLVARNRHRLFNQDSCRVLTGDSDRFLN
jgi:predicted DCC family thiol-disulfide oxidoreductase YuxK